MLVLKILTTINIGWYRKLSNTLNFTNQNISKPKFYKIKFYKTCSTNGNFKRDIDKLKDSCIRSNYPQKVINT